MALLAVKKTRSRSPKNTKNKANRGMPLESISSLRNVKGSIRLIGIYLSYVYPIGQRVANRGFVVTRWKYLLHQKLPGENKMTKRNMKHKILVAIDLSLDASLLHGFSHCYCMYVTVGIRHDKGPYPGISR